MECFFCKEYARMRDQHALIESRNGITHHDIKAVMLLISWNELSGRHHWGETTHRPKPGGFDLNYCPECGRRLADG